MNLFNKKSKITLKKATTEHQLLETWLNQNRQRFIAMASSGVSQESDEWKALAAERSEKMKRFTELSKMIGTL